MIRQLHHNNHNSSPIQTPDPRPQRRDERRGTIDELPSSIVNRVLCLRSCVLGLVSWVLCLACSVAALVSAQARAVAGQDFVPFVIPARPDANSPMAFTSFRPIETGSDRLVAQAGHFHLAGQRVRLWGVNLSFGANLPQHADAPHVAARLAAAGVNAVRCHHMDSARWPRGLWNAQNGKTIAPEALDRLDYFIAQLARHGIFVDINLHVGRAHSQYLGLPETNRQYDKISTIFTPELIDAQKKYARDLLTHFNPYRNVRYADDPAVAIVEITNENSLFMWDAEETLRTLPRYYAEILQNKFNTWLTARYGSDDNLRTAWSQGAEPLGENLLRNGNFQIFPKGGGVPQNWHLEQHSGCIASVSPHRRFKDALRVEITKADETQWHLQFNQGGLPVKAGRYYTVIFEAVSDMPRLIGCNVGQAHSPWKNLGLSRQVELGQQWQTYRFGFVANEDDDNARVNFAFSGSTIPFYLANVQFRPGGRVALYEGESIQAGTVALFVEGQTPARSLDSMCFLAETEKAYFDQMREFIRNDIGCRALVTGTVVFGPLGLYAQSDMDFIDSHAYWQHPRFPGKPWDSNNWFIEQKPMADYPAEATLFQLAARRLAGKPFTVSEYNHPAPLDSQAECVPMLASFAAAQDWDGVWLYTYSHTSDSWDREYLNSYFDIDTNPSKWGFMRAGAAIFRCAGIEPLSDSLVVCLTDNLNTAATLPSLAALHLKHDTNMFAVLSDLAGISRDDVLKARLFARFGSEGSALALPNGGPAAPGAQHGGGDSSLPTRLDWSVENGKGIYIARGQCASVYTGHAERFEEFSTGPPLLSAPAPASSDASRGSGPAYKGVGPELVSITATALDETQVDRSQKILVTACGRCENTGMGFSRDRRTVGTNWGSSPVRIQAVEGTLVLPAGRWICHALGPDGLVKQQIAVSYRDGQAELQLSPQYGTMWYLLRRDTAEESRDEGRGMRDEVRNQKSEVRSHRSSSLVHRLSFIPSLHRTAYAITLGAMSSIVSRPSSLVHRPSVFCPLSSAQVVLFDFTKGFDVGSVITNDAQITLSESGTLRIATGHNKPKPGITLKAPAGKWDLSKYEYVSIDVKNLARLRLGTPYGGQPSIADEPVTVSCRVDGPGADGNSVSDSITLAGQEAGILTVRIFPTPWKLSEPLELIGMRGVPVHSGKLDTANISQMLVFVNKPRIDYVFELGNIRAGGCVTVLDAKTFFPFIDEFGQFIHGDWPGKTHSLEELIANSARGRLMAGKAEEEDLAAHPGPADRDVYGGWSAGPVLSATGFFRTEKYKGKWWFVDPQGRLFWSHGIDCVRSANATPITDREHYFRNLPAPASNKQGPETDSPFAKFYGAGSWAPHGYYKDHCPYKTYDFSQANLLRKYGQDWEKAFAEITHRRLKSWGINTIANWSDPNIYLMRKMPYVCTISYDARKLEGSQGYWGKFYDVFDPSFRQALRRRLEMEKGKTAGDPWCIGYFVHNELSWGDEVSLAVATLISPPDQPAKKVFIEDLKAKYGTIDKLNAAWDTEHATWDALLQSPPAQSLVRRAGRQAPDKEKARADLTAFYTKIAETYFETIRDELKKVAPNQLYMGCRFAWVNDRAARAAAKFCDVVSYNRYTSSVQEQRLPDNISAWGRLTADKPIIIGEFHFGALDRGMFHTGLRKTDNQQDRAEKYKSYVCGALRNPYIVGTHWFQYKDQATTGRGDGENYQIGFVDVCDRPYPEIVRACRDVAIGLPVRSNPGSLYEFRLKSQ